MAEAEKNAVTSTMADARELAAKYPVKAQAETDALADRVRSALASVAAKNTRQTPTEEASIFDANVHYVRRVLADESAKYPRLSAAASSAALITAKWGEELSGTGKPPDLTEVMEVMERGLARTKRTQLERLRDAWRAWRGST